MRASCLVAFVLFTSASALAQTRPVEEPEERGGQTRTDEERRYDDLIARFQNDYLRVTTLVRIVPTVPLEDADFDQPGFDVAAAWLGIGGRLGENVGYFVRGAFERDPTLLEAFVSYGSDDVRVLVGRQKVPFSYEFLVGGPTWTLSSGRGRCAFSGRAGGRAPPSTPISGWSGFAAASSTRATPPT